MLSVFSDVPLDKDIYKQIDITVLNAYMIVDDLKSEETNYLLTINIQKDGKVSDEQTVNIISSNQFFKYIRNLHKIEQEVFKSIIDFVTKNFIRL